MGHPNRETVDLGFISDESLTRQGLNLNPGHFHGSAILPLFIWRIVFACLMVCRCDMAGNDEDRGSSRTPVVEDQGRSSTGQVLGAWVIGMSGDAMCGLHRARGDEESGFLG
jgi:hypothetical protein